MAFPTLLCQKFQKDPSPASDCPSSSWIQVCSQTLVAMIFGSSTRAFHTCNESWILKKPPAGISWSRNQSFLLLLAFPRLAQEGGEGHMQPWASWALPTACFYAWTQNLSCQLGCWQRVDDVLSFVPRARSLHSIHCVAALVSVQDRCCSTLDFHPK